MDETAQHHAEWNKPVSEGQELCDFIYIWNIKQWNSDTESRMMLPGPTGKGNRELFNGYKVLIMQDDILDIHYTA